MSAERALDRAQQLDAADLLAVFRHEFVIDDPDLVYLDGNSLGRLPKRTAELLRLVVEQQWGGRLVRGWGEHWIQLPQRVGAKIAKLIGAEPDEVIVSDSTSVNLYKLATAALRGRPGRAKVVTDDANFPSDVYLLDGCAQAEGRSLQIVASDEVRAALNTETALISLSHTSFKSALIHPMAVLTAAAHEVGALTMWDLSHSVGAVPVDLNGSGADLAVGCTYKYLNGGPGAPAFLYVRRDLQEKLCNPIWGWFGQKNPFAFSLEYEPADGLTRYLAGTPSILSLAAIEGGVDLILEAGMDGLRAKSVAQTTFLIELWEEFLEPLGVELNSPRDAAVRGSHVSFGHPNAYQIDQALIEIMNVVPDFRTPDNIRFGITPISTTYTELVHGVLRMREVIVREMFTAYPSHVNNVT